MNYSGKLRDPRWQKVRLRVLERDGFKCTTCGDDKSELHVHHLRYEGEPWDCPDVYLSTKCFKCHKIAHKWESMNAFILKLMDEVPSEYHAGIIKHLRFTVNWLAKRERKRSKVTKALFIPLP